MCRLYNLRKVNYITCIKQTAKKKKGIKTMEKMISELIYLKETKTNFKRFNKLFWKAAQTYADFYGRDISEGVKYVEAQIRR